MASYTRLTWTDRLSIEKLYKQGSSERAIARYLHRAPSTIHYELQHGFYEHLDSKTYQIIKLYSADKAQQYAEYQATSRGGPVKLGHNYAYAQIVSERIKSGESPDSITGDLARSNQWTVSTPTLYRYIDMGYIPDVSNKNLLIKSKRKKSKPHPKAKRPPKGTSIEQRPPAINDRAEMGHWEQDTVIGKSKGKSESLLVLTERVTRYEIIRKLKDKTAAEVLVHLSEIIPGYPPGTFKTITVDNGSENQDYDGMKKLVPEVYYCHPYSSFERGSNENANKIIRRFFPKGESMKDKTQADADIAQAFMNQMHRKILGYATSQELFDAWQKALQNTG